MAVKSLSRDFMLDPDQDARRAELMAFIGPNAEKFIPVYESWRATMLTEPGVKRLRMKRGFVGTAFLLGPTWFFYRKLWGLAAGIVVLMVALALIPVAGRLGLIVSIILGMMAKMTYLDHAMKRIVSLRGTAAVADLAVLQRKGGISKPAGWISGSLMVLLMVLGILSVIYLAMHNGGRVPRDL